MKGKTPAQPTKKAAPAKKQAGVDQAEQRVTPTDAGSIPAPGAKRHRLDWEAIERDYRTDKFTLRELAAKHTTNAATIVRRQKDDRALDPSRWQKDLGPVVRQATNALLVQQMVNNEVNRGQHEVNNAVLVAAELGKNVILRHREDIQTMRGVAMDMLGELSLTTHKADEIANLFESVVASELSGPGLAAVQQQFRDFMRLHARVGSAQKLADVLVKLQPAERRAFNLDDEGKGGGSQGWEDLVSDIEGQLPA